QDWTWFNVGGWGNREHGIERCRSGGKSGVGPRVAGAVETGRWYDLRVECEDDRIKTFVDGQLVHDVRDLPPPEFAAVAGRRDRDGAIVLKVCKGGNGPRRVGVELRGAGAVAAVATGELLTSRTLDDENSLLTPDQVAPRPLRLDDAG